MFVRMFLTYLSLMLLLGALLYMRLISPLKLKRKWKIFWAIIDVFFMIAAGISLPLTVYASRFPSTFQEYHLNTTLPIGYTVITFFILLLAAIFIRDIIFFIHRIIRLIREARSKKPEKSTDNEDPNLVSRRQFIQCIASGGTVGVALACTPISVYYARSRRVIKNIQIELPSIPESLNGLRIVHLSDIHVGNTIQKEHIAEIVKETNDLNPDIIAITGDMADGMPDDIGSWLDPMRDFKSKYGVYFVTGNHDHMWDGKGWCECIEKLNIDVLNNEHRIIDIHGTPMVIAGAIDAYGDRHIRKWHSDPEAALKSAPQNLFKLMLVHQPSTAEKSLKFGADLVLAGHTHGGQFWPMTYIVNAIHKYSRGLYYINDKAIFVSCGTGYWGPPIRFGVPPEINVITLKHK